MWEARRFRDERLCTLDSGPALLPIPLPLCSGDICHLQWCVDAWHMQSSVHALTRPAPLLCLQLLRFHNEVRDVQRDTRPLQDHLTTIHVPVSLIRSCPWSCTTGQRQLRGTIKPFCVANLYTGKTKDGLLTTIVPRGPSPAQSLMCIAVQCM